MITSFDACLYSVEQVNLLKSLATANRMTKLTKAIAGRKEEEGTTNISMKSSVLDHGTQQRTVFVGCVTDARRIIH